MFSYLLIPRLTNVIARSQELLFLFSISWCFALIALFQYLGFTLEIGALIAGITLSISPYSGEISSRIRPLRDFFIIIFFIILGLNVPIKEISSVAANALWLSLFVIIVKPLIVIAIMKFGRYTRRISFITGITLAQISEFSLIVLALGVKVNQIPQEILTTLTLTGIITMTLSTYFIIYSEEIYKIISKIFRFHKRDPKELEIESSYHAILFGYNRIGFSLLESLRKIDRSYLVVDYNPDTISKLKKKHTPYIYGDAYDEEFLDQLPLRKTKMIISTIPEFETNSLLIKNVRRRNRDTIIIVIAHQIQDALDFYAQGATYVLMPHFLGGDYVSKMIEKYQTDPEFYLQEKRRQIQKLRERISEGHEHPRHEKK